MLSYTLNISCSQYYDDKKGYLPFTEMHFKDIVNKVFKNRE
jgi:hypothetical protein